MAWLATQAEWPELEPQTHRNMSGTGHMLVLPALVKQRQMEPRGLLLTSQLCLLSKPKSMRGPA